MSVFKFDVLSCFDRGITIKPIPFINMIVTQKVKKGLLRHAGLDPVFFVFSVASGFRFPVFTGQVPPE